MANRRPDSATTTAIALTGSRLPISGAGELVWVAIVRSASGNGCNPSLSSQPVGIGQRQPLAGLRPSSRGAGAASGRAPEKLQMQMLVFRFTAMATVGDSAPHAVHDGRRPFWFVAVRWPRQAGMTRLTRRPLPSNRRPMPSCL